MREVEAEAGLTPAPKAEGGADSGADAGTAEADAEFPKPEETPTAHEVRPGHLPKFSRAIVRLSGTAMAGMMSGCTLVRFTCSLLSGRVHPGALKKVKAWSRFLAMEMAF